MKNIRTNKFNLSFLLFWRPKMNRRMESSGDSMNVFMRHYRDWIYFSFWGERSDPLWWTLSRGSLRSPQKNKFNLSFFSFYKPKMNRRMTIRRCSMDVFMRHYRDWIQKKNIRTNYSISIICLFINPKTIAEWQSVDIQWLFLWDIIEIK